MYLWIFTFGLIKYLRLDDEIIHAVEDFVIGQGLLSDFVSGIETLKHRRQKNIDFEGGYVEK